MSRFVGRVTRDLDRIADEASPSPTAWESIQTRIDDRTDQPDTEVTMLAPDTTKSTKRSRIRAGALAVAAAIVIVVGVVALRSVDDDPATVAGPGSAADAEQAVRIAQEFVEARDAWDGEAVRALVADDAVIDGFVSTPDEYLTNVEFERATGWRFMQPECAATAVGPPTEVTCTYTMENAWSGALGVGPFTGSTFEFLIANGEIQQLTHDFDTSVFSPQVWENFQAWVHAAHPSDASIIYNPNGSAPLKTPEAVALWEQHTKEFVAVRTAQRFVEARDAWDGEAVRALVADDAAIDGFVSTADEYLTNVDFERATGWRFMHRNCGATAVGPPAEVTCTYTMENAWSRALGAGPFTGSTFELVIADGEIQQITHDFDFSVFSSQVWEVFKAWVSETHPADVGVMYDFSGADDVPVKTAEAIALWEQHTAEFVASQGDS